MPKARIVVTVPVHLEYSLNIVTPNNLATSWNLHNPASLTYVYCVSRVVLVERGGMALILSSRPHNSLREEYPNSLPSPVERDVDSMTLRTYQTNRQRDILDDILWSDTHSGMKTASLEAAKNNRLQGSRQ